MRRFLPVLLAAALLAPPAARGEVIFQSGETPIHLLELYTSEGCSSCPPAERWLTALRTEPSLWKTFVPVAWHVDYWDHLGWKDPLASRNNSIRQRAQAAEQLATTYTPGFFLNGREWRGFFDGKPLPPADAPEAGRLRAVQLAPLEFVVEFKPSGPDATDLELWGALLGMDIAVPVTGGENRGEDLVHDFAVLGTASKRVPLSGGKYTARITLRNDTRVAPESTAAAFWVAPVGKYRPIQAAGGFLPPGDPSRDR